MFCKQSAVTEVLTQTLCPTWDQTLIFDDIEIHECVENVAENPPSVVVELFDRDSVVSFGVGDQPQTSRDETKKERDNQLGTRENLHRA